mgnify:CR=1 FL=1
MTNKNNLSKKEKEIQEDIRELVLARIRAASGDLNVSIGSVVKGYSKKELIESVEAGDEIGKEIVDIQMEYLKDIAQGKIYSLDDNSHN